MYYNVGPEAAYLSKQGLILSKLSDLREAHGVELAELPLEEPGPGPRPISEPDPWLKWIIINKVMLMGFKCCSVF